MNTHKPQPTGFKIGHAAPNFKVKPKDTEITSVETKMEEVGVNKVSNGLTNTEVKVVYGTKPPVHEVVKTPQVGKVYNLEKVPHVEKIPVTNGTFPRKSSTSRSGSDSRKESVTILPWRNEPDSSVSSNIQKEPIDGIILREDRRTSSRPTLLVMGSREEKPLEVNTNNRESFGTGIRVETLSPRSEISFKIEPATSPLADVKKMNNFFERQISASKTLPMAVKKVDKFSTLPNVKKIVAAPPKAETTKQPNQVSVASKKSDSEIAAQSEVVTKPLSELRDENDGIDPTTQMDVRKLMFTFQAHPEPINIHNEQGKVKQKSNLYNSPPSPVASQTEQKSPEPSRLDVKKLAHRLNSHDSGISTNSKSNTLPRQDLSRQSSASSTASSIGNKSLPPTGLKISHPKASFSVNKSQTLPRQLSSGCTTIFQSTEMLNHKEMSQSPEPRAVSNSPQPRKVSSLEIKLSGKPLLSAQSSVQSDISSFDTNRSQLSPQSSVSSLASKTPSPQLTVKIMKNETSITCNSSSPDTEVVKPQLTSVSVTPDPIPVKEAPKLLRQVTPDPIPVKEAPKLSLKVNPDSVPVKEAPKLPPIKVKSSLHSSTKRPAPPPPISPKPTAEELAIRVPISPQPVNGGSLYRKKLPAPPPPVRGSSLLSPTKSSPPPPPSVVTSTPKSGAVSPPSHNKSSLFSTVTNNNTSNDSGVDVNFDAKEHVSFSKELANAPNNYKDIVKTSDTVNKPTDVYFNDVSLRNIKLDIDPDRNSVVRIVKK